MGSSTTVIDLKQQLAYLHSKNGGGDCEEEVDENKGCRGLFIGCQAWRQSPIPNANICADVCNDH
jgi:hypothetical protein